MPPERLRSLPVRSLDEGLRVYVAASPRARLLGLIGLRELPPGSGLWLPGARSIHTFGMRFPIDLVWRERGGEVVRVDEHVPPGRLRSCWAARSVVETAAGQGRRLAAALGADRAGQGVSKSIV